MAVSKGEGIEDLTEFAVEAIRLSGKEALSYYAKGDKQIKFDEDLVTQAELHLSNFFQDQLRSRFSEHQVFENRRNSEDYSHEGKRLSLIHI